MSRVNTVSQQMLPPPLPLTPSPPTNKPCVEVKEIGTRDKRSARDFCEAIAQQWFACFAPPPLLQTLSYPR